MYLTLYLTLSSWDKKARPKNSQWAQGPGPLVLTGFEDSFRQKHHLRRRKRRLRSGSAVGGRTRGSAVTFNYELITSARSQCVHYGPNLGPRPRVSRRWGSKLGLKSRAPRRRPGRAARTRGGSAGSRARRGRRGRRRRRRRGRGRRRARERRARAPRAPRPRRARRRRRSGRRRAPRATSSPLTALAPSASSTSKASSNDLSEGASVPPPTCSAAKARNESGRPTPLASAASKRAAASSTPQPPASPPSARKNSERPSAPSPSRSSAAKPRRQSSSRSAGARAATTCATSLPRPSSLAKARAAWRVSEQSRAEGRACSTRSQGSRRACSAVSRFSTSRSSSRATKSRASCDAPRQSRAGNCSGARATRLRISRSVRPANGGQPLRST